MESPFLSPRAQLGGPAHDGRVADAGSGGGGGGGRAGRVVAAGARRFNMRASIPSVCAFLAAPAEFYLTGAGRRSCLFRRLGRPRPAYDTVRRVSRLLRDVSGRHHQGKLAQSPATPRPPRGDFDNVLSLPVKFAQQSLEVLMNGSVSPSRPCGRHQKWRVASRVSYICLAGRRGRGRRWATERIFSDIRDPQCRYVSSVPHREMTSLWPTEVSPGGSQKLVPAGCPPPPSPQAPINLPGSSREPAPSRALAR